MAEPTKAKICKIGIAWGMEKQYQVKTITNSTKYTPGQWLDIPDVEALCADPNWDVVITDDVNFGAVIAAFLGAAVTKFA